MRVALLVPAAAAALLVLALLPTPPAAPVQVPDPPRGALANEGLDHFWQSEPPPELQPAPEPTNEVVVFVRDGAFEPAELSVPRGTHVKFLHRDDAAHTVTGRLAGQAALVLDEELRPGREASLVLAQVGTYELRCRYHSPDFGQGMAARVGVMG